MTLILFWNLLMVFLVTWDLFVPYLNCMSSFCLFFTNCTCMSDPFVKNKDNKICMLDFLSLELCPFPLYPSSVLPLFSLGVLFGNLDLHCLHDCIIWTHLHRRAAIWQTTSYPKVTHYHKKNDLWSNGAKILSKHACNASPEVSNNVTPSPEAVPFSKRTLYVA